MDPWRLVEAVGSSIFVLCLLPQFARTLRRGRAEDVSLGFLILVNVGSVIMVPYAAQSGQWFLLSSFSMNLVVWGLVLWYRVRPRARATPLV